MKLRVSSKNILDLRGASFVVGIQIQKITLGILALS